MKFIKNTPFTWVALAVFLESRILLIAFWQPWISDVSFYFDVATEAWSKGHVAYQDFMWAYPPLSLSIVYLPYSFAPTPDSYRLVFRLITFAYECVFIGYFGRFLVDRLKLDAKAATIGICSYSVLGMFQGHLIYDRLDLLLGLCLMMSLYYVSDPRIYRSVVPGVVGVLWKVMPILWLPVVGLFIAYQHGMKALIRSALIGAIPTAIVLVGWNVYSNGHLFSTLDMHNKRGIQIESTWASFFMVEKVLNTSAKIRIGDSYGAQHLGGEDVPGWVVAASKVVGFSVLAAFYLHLSRRLHKIRNGSRAKTFNIYIGAMFAMSAPYFLFCASQRVLSPQYFLWWLPTLGILYAWRPRWLDIGLGTLVMMLTSIEFDGMRYFGIDVSYLDYVEFNPFLTWVVTVRNVLLLLFAIRFIVLYRDYFSDEPKFVKDSVRGARL